MSNEQLLPACKENDYTIVGERDNALARELMDLKPSSIKFHVNQVPYQDNNHTAIVTGEVQTANGSYTGIGAAIPESLDSTISPQQLIDEAAVKALYRATRLATFCCDADTEVTCCTVTPAKHTAVTSPTTFKSGNTKHKTQSGTITPKQIDFLKQLAEYNGTTVNNFAKTYCNKTPNQLSSSEANMIIQRVKNE